MNRREFLCSAVTAGTAMVGLGESLSGAPLDPGSAQRTLAEHRITKIELEMRRRQRSAT